MRRYRLALSLAAVALAAAPAFAQRYDAEGRLYVNDKPWVLGQATMSASTPVVLASDQTTLNVAGLSGCSGSSGLTDTQLRATPVPVSGTFWQSTQPVSLAAVPTHAVTQSGTWTVTGAGGTFPVTGTFWQSTQPVSIASMPSTPVTGTFWQATQPVSGTFWQATQPVSATALPLPTGASTLAEQQTQTTALQTIDNLVLAQASTTSGQVGVLVQGAVGTSAPSYTDAKTSPLSLTASGLLRTDAFPTRWTCALDAIAASLTQCQAAPAAGLRLWITNVVAVSTTTTAATFAIRQGTGTNCGTGTAGLLPGASTSRTYVLPASTAAPWQVSSVSGIGATAANAICVIGAATNTLSITISGYTAP